MTRKEWNYKRKEVRKSINGYIHNEIYEFRNQLRVRAIYESSSPPSQSFALEKWSNGWVWFWNHRMLGFSSSSDRLEIQKWNMGFRFGWGIGMKGCTEISRMLETNMEIQNLMLSLGQCLPRFMGFRFG